MSEVQRSRDDVAEAELRDREARIYRMVVGALCIATIVFGLLNLGGIIRM